MLRSFFKVKKLLQSRKWENLVCYIAGDCNYSFQALSMYILVNARYIQAFSMITSVQQRDLLGVKAKLLLFQDTDQ